MGCNGEWFEWMSADVEVPAVEDVLVLCVVNGLYKNITFQNAFCLASYSNSEGWILEMWPDWENPDVKHWTYLPELPKEG